MAIDNDKIILQIPGFYIDDKFDNKWRISHNKVVKFLNNINMAGFRSKGQWRSDFYSVSAIFQMSQKSLRV